MKTKITKPFCVFISQDTDFADNGLWVAQIVGGDGLDFVTQADSPEGAAFMAWDLLRMMTDRCTIDCACHTFAEEAPFADGSPALVCARCGDMIPKPPAAPLAAPPIAISADGRCNCNAASTCPLGRHGSQDRCTGLELEAAGIPTSTTL